MRAYFRRSNLAEWDEGSNHNSKVTSKETEEAWARRTISVPPSWVNGRSGGHQAVERVGDMGISRETRFSASRRRENWVSNSREHNTLKEWIERRNAEDYASGEITSGRRNRGTFWRGCPGVYNLRKSEGWAKAYLTNRVNLGREMPTGRRGSRIGD